MAQIKIYGLRATLDEYRTPLSHAIHRAVVQTLNFPDEKRFHRFLALEADDFLFSSEKSENYIIIEVLMMEGRSEATKKRLIHALFENIEKGVGIVVKDVEICILESPKCNWGFRGQTGDEIALGYRVEV